MKVTDGYLGRFEGGDDFFVPRATVTVEKREGVLAMRWSMGGVSWLVPMTQTKFYDRIFGGVVTFVKGNDVKVSQLTVRIAGTDYRANKTKD